MMSAEVRLATIFDLSMMVDLVLHNARDRQSRNPAFWALDNNPRQRVEAALRSVLGGGDQPIRQNWHVGEYDGTLGGVIHSMKLPVPPIYAGKWGEPGLILSDYFVTSSAPDGTIPALIAAAEADLLDAGAQLFIAACVPEDGWQSILTDLGYAPLTLYLSKTGFEYADVSGDVRNALEDDLASIIELSAENRAILGELDIFWEPHPDADVRFGNWMRRSLTLGDRDMLVSGTGDLLSGYLIAQPASRLHFPAAHAVEGIGVIDDYFHKDYADFSKVNGDGKMAAALLRAGESAFKRRGIETGMIVCPAAWKSKIAVLAECGYSPALVWMIKRLEDA